MAYQAQREGTFWEAIRRGEGDKTCRASVDGGWQQEKGRRGPGGGGRESGKGKGGEAGEGKARAG